MSNKLKKLILSASAMLLLGGALTGCDDVIATPPHDQYDEASILDLEGVENNTMKQIYDALVKEGDSNSERVLKNILKVYSESLFGNFWDIKAAVDGSDTAGLQKIANDHEVYHDKDGNGQTAKVYNMYQDFLYRIKKVFYGYVTNTSYQERSQFVESKFYDAQVKANYNLGSDFYEDAKPIRGSFRVLETLDATELTAYYKDLFVTYKEYIELAVLPDIYRDELVCQYLYTVNYRSLGLSYARKIDVVKLAENTTYPDATKKLVNSYAKNVIEVSSVNASTYDFTFLDRLYKGIPFDYAGLDASIDSTLVDAIYADAGWNLFTSADTGYDAFILANPEYSGLDIYKESTFGGYISDYLKIYDNTVDDSSVVSDFSNSGAYTTKTGLQIKKNTLEATDNTTHGWYNQSGVGSVVPNDVSKRLFKITVAQEVDTNITDGRFGYYRNGGYYMIPEQFETGTAHPYIINDGSTYYFVRVDEAVMSSKLNDGDPKCYDTTRGAFAAEQIARQIAGILSSSDTYKSDSNKYWVEKMAIIYHDTSVYEYFKKTFPSLFEDD